MDETGTNPQPLDTAGGIGTWLRFAAVFLLLCGLFYPSLTTWLARGLFPHQAEGSLIERGGRVLGSELLGQPFSGARYFIGRPSAAGYDPRVAAGSNFAVSNPALRERLQQDAQVIARREGVRVDQIPPDLLAASGSGLDPHISPEAARL
ncbi:MAG TPA: potassium-transporting ATPase subunit C, partial [Candidatus Macondimonas sp.]|nr:potassium-transporting ATPase subunit C [Candidatus Macondimonas sp.]